MAEDDSKSFQQRPRICRNCGSIVGGGESRCAVCGEALVTDVARRTGPGPDSETIRFARAILNRPYIFTVGLLVANLFVFLLMWQASGLTSSALWEFPDQVLLGFGAKLNVLITEQRQWWRFVTPMFVHVNLPHLLVNMYSLWMVGPYVEKLYGSAKFLVFWVVTGIAGVLASFLTVRPEGAFGLLGRFLFKTTDVPSAGASGALFGLVGVLFVFGIKFRHELPEGFKKAFGTGMLPIILINLFIGYLGRGFIDNAAHVGGLVSGALLALVVNYRRPGERTSAAALWKVLQVICLILVVVSFLMAYRRAPAQRNLPEMVLSNQPEVDRFVAYVKSMNEAQEALYYAIHDRDTSRLANSVKQIDAAPQLDAKSDELRQTLQSMMDEAKSITPADKTEADAQTAKEARFALAKRFRLWSKQYGEWLKTTGRNYGGLVEITEATPL